MEIAASANRTDAFIRRLTILVAILAPGQLITGMYSGVLIVFQVYLA